MIKFFRNIRQRMIKEKRFSKYLLYAIGEIILVVIGILIALWINQQANFSKERETETNVLKEIRSNLKNDLVEINEDIWAMDSTEIACNYVLKHLRDEDSPNLLFGRKALMIMITAHFNPNKSGYNLLESKGVEIVQNDSLRRAISDHYESLYSYYERYEQERIQFRIQTMEPQLMEFFTWTEDSTSAFLGQFEISQAEYSALRENEKFKKMVAMIKRANNLVQNRARRVDKSINVLINLLDEELDEQEG